ncbi:hypothetical protein C8P63_10327 [Melghirimyces profundicolus]|uniref:Uncharacterized protein n=1 Tax=Melghirimyces profundicolus TaxID=1242148 RepID=A0A2T6C7H2_9BACL|nr:hypothetical protein [Melghirimyces profundicolus]PTX64245.1 hypothetical protein C8P63_10327 [Melghirimyces profundicolus]
MERKDRKRGRTHMDPLEQATEALPEVSANTDEGTENRDRLDHEEGVKDPNRLSYSEQFKRL